MLHHELECLLPMGVNTLKTFSDKNSFYSKKNGYVGTEFQQEVIRVHDDVLNALKEPFNEEKRKDLYEKSCDISQRHKERNDILEWVQRGKEDVIGKGEVHRRGNLASLWAPIEFNADKSIKYPVNKYDKGDVIKQYSAMIDIIENQIVLKGIDGYGYKRLKYINKQLDMFQEDPMIFDMGSILLLSKDGKWYEENI